MFEKISQHGNFEGKSNHESSDYDYESQTFSHGTEEEKIPDMLNFLPKDDQKTFHFTGFQEKIDFLTCFVMSSVILAIKCSKTSKVPADKLVPTFET